MSDGSAAVQGEVGESGRRLRCRGPGGATLNRLGKTMLIVETRRRQSAGVSRAAKGAVRAAGSFMGSSLGV